MIMSIRFIALLYFCVFSFISNAQSHKVILDTDIDSDVDDVGALAMLHTLANYGVVDILGVIVTSDDHYAAQCTDAINHYFKKREYSGWRGERCHFNVLFKIHQGNQ